MTLDDLTIIIPTWKNPTWLARCLSSLAHNTRSPLVKKIIVSGPMPLQVECGPLPVEWHHTPEDWTALDKMRHAMRYLTSSDLVMFLQDDCLVLPGRLDWIERLVYPFTVDKFVALSSTVTNACSMPHQLIRNALVPGYYYSSAVVPICFLANRKVLLESLDLIPHDLFCDQEVALNLIERGHKIVLCTNVPIYHEGMRSSLIQRGEEGLHAWAREAKERIKRELPNRHGAVWIQRMEEMEMVPMDNAFATTGENVSLRLW